MDELTNNKILVIGDGMVDHYMIGNVSRVSPEAPVPVVNVNENRYVLGGAANVANQLAYLGVEVSLISRVGDDLEAEKYRNLLSDANIGDSSVVDSSICTVTKTRVIGNGQQITRIDKEEISSIGKGEELVIIDMIKKLGQSCAAVIVSDYAKGLITQKVACAITDLAAHGVKVFVDPHPKNSEINWSGAYTVKPNLAEIQSISGVEVDKNELSDAVNSPSLNVAIDAVMEDWKVSNLLVTLSEYGMLYTDQSEQFQINAQVEQVYDVSGAGDTVIAIYSVASAAGWSARESAELATVASGIVVKKLGTAVVGLTELEEAWRARLPT